MAKLHEEGQRVTKLWKDQRWQSNMATAGISANIAEMDFRLKLDEKDMGKTYDRLVDAVKGRVAKSVKKCDSVEELMEFTKEITGYRMVLEASELDRNPTNEEDNNSIKLLFACIKENPSTEGMKKLNPIRIKVTHRNGKEAEGITFLHQKIKKSKHDTSRYMPGSWTSNLVFDLNRLIAEVMVDNALIEFAKSNMKNLRFTYAKDFGNRMIRKIGDRTLLYVPKKEEFKEELLSFLHDNHLYPAGVDEERSFSPLDGEEPYFHLQEQDNVEYYVIQTWLRSVVSFEFLEQMYRARDKTKKEIEQAKHFESARAFETKQNIPKSHLAKMRNNAFLPRYHYVEIDEMLEISEFEKLEEEFRKLQTLTFIPYSEGSFRVRRLGRHKAAGMYFPHVNATIIDENSSYVHELHHQIDYTCSDNGLLSESIAFRPVLEAYKRAVNEQVEALADNDPFKTQWNGSTKYNKNYFMDPAEVFARSGELYLSEVKEIETSFLKPSYKGKPQYPVTDDFLEVIKEYFDRLYNTFYTEGKKEEKKKEKVAAASPPAKNPEPFEVGDVGNGEQLTLF